MEIFKSKTAKVVTFIVVLLLIAAIALPIYISTLKRDDGTKNTVGASSQESAGSAGTSTAVPVTHGAVPVTQGGNSKSKISTETRVSISKRAASMSTTTKPVINRENTYISNGALTFSKRGFHLNGTRFRILSGAVHYFRTVPAYWRDRLSKLKACGLNTVET
jgi:hypothetical protein